MIPEMPADTLAVLIAIAMAMIFANARGRRSTIEYLTRFGRWGAESVRMMVTESAKAVRAELVKWGVAGAVTAAGVVTTGYFGAQLAETMAARFDPVMQQPERRGTGASPAAGGGGGTVVFASSWETATGSTVNALADSTADVPWTRYTDPPVMTVIADPYDFPSDNIVRVNNDEGGYVAIDVADNVIADTLQSGGTRAYRLYFRYSQGQTTVTDNDTHGFTVATPALSAIPSAAFTGNDFDLEPFKLDELQADNSEFTHRVDTDFGTNGNDCCFYYPTALPEDSTFILETWVRALSDTTITLHARITEIDGTSIAEDADFCNWFLGCGGGDLADSATIDLQRGLEQFNSIFLGLNGYTGEDGSILYYFDNFAVCSGDPCGLYTAGEAGN